MSGIMRVKMFPHRDSNPGLLASQYEVVTESSCGKSYFYFIKTAVRKDERYHASKDVPTPGLE
uniref:Uncharacterized protein n=1 Tax=Hyaloperonospora arabidopsidis (strain Emoy2) TaxID=559515 RepID=M4C0V0_HYAAE